MDFAFSFEIWKSLCVGSHCESKNANGNARFAIVFGLFTFTFSHLADAFIQSDLQMRTMEAIKINKRAMICKCYDKSQLA